MRYQLEALAVCAVVFIYLSLRRRKRLAIIKDVPGPVNPSWIFGTLPVAEGRSDPSCLLETDGLRTFKGTSGTSR